MVKVSPSLLSADFSNLREDLKKIERADSLHLDIMDGQFVPNLSFGVPVVKSIRKWSKLRFDAHLMISKPDKYAQPFAEAGADLIVFHVETGHDPKILIKQIKDLGVKVGMSIDGLTGVEKILPYLSEIDHALVMSVKAGFSGQEFMPEAIRKIGAIRETVDKERLDCEICVDGGINLDTGQLCVEAGADILVSGSFLFKQNSPAITIREMQKLR